MFKHAVTGALLVSAGVILSGTAQAQSLNLTQPSYTHFSGGVSETSSGNRGFTLDGEYEFGHKFFMTGTYRQIRQRFSDGSSFNESLIDVGVGRYFNVYDRTTLDASVSLGHYALSSNVFSSDGSPFYTLNSGIRQRHDAFEYRLGYRYIDMDGYDSTHGAVASAYFYFTPQTAIGVHFNDVYSRSTWSFGMRFLF
ncbi:hypothetical protein CWE09_04685 [Aliidiomarina minuta]|uniref:Outer membrane protein beta-barrel domain-containing protein n=1 Tax=Aliidiomarina minuta TaxID=880057 RepID=A0A432W7H5_9GAMM|nr:hypothetical protein [Aliidiomarina minuta]RUO26027.1 hypothetical protein CWE09_04685 [Aliidiomarina minuta]